MGREKNSPKKRYSDCGYSGYYDYFPAIKKHRRSSSKSTPTSKVYKIQLATESQNQFYIGKFIIGTARNNVLPKEYSDCHVSFKSPEEDKGADVPESSLDSIVIEFDEDLKVTVKSYADTDLLKEIFGLKEFSFDFEVTGEEIQLKLFFTTLPLQKFQTKFGYCIKTIFKLIYGIETVTDADTIHATYLNGTAEIAKLFENLAIRRSEALFLNEEKVEHCCLIPKLRPYQETSVRWMLHREKISLQESETLHPLFIPVKLTSGLTIYLDKYTGYVDLEKPLIPASSRGGILADEMGLGKTVEVLACLLLNPKDAITKANSPIKIENQSKKPTMKVDEVKPYVDRPKKIKVPEDWVKSSGKRKSATRVALEMWYDNVLTSSSAACSAKEDEDPKKSVQCICGSTSEEDVIACDSCGKYQHENCLGYNKSFGRYLCPQCWMEEPLVATGATLIVTPVALKTQWCKEICRHLKGNLKVLRYDGFKATPVYPTQLKEYHIVVTTYNVLQNELRLTKNGQVINLRREKKYSPPGSPLTRVRWWRLCLDEAQTVETPSCMVSAMAKKIDAVYRWAVTGTPISKNVSDLYGLIDYLQITPYNDPATWKNILFTPYVSGDQNPMIDFLSQVLWRTCKKDVADQINIPKQTYQEHLLEFSAVEKYFYKREHELICKAFLSTATKFDLSLLLEKLDKSCLKRLLAPLYTLRHTCTHPNTVRGRYLATKKQVTSMQDLLNALILKNTTDSEDCLRLTISALNDCWICISANWLKQCNSQIRLLQQYQFSPCLAGLQLLLQDPQQAIDYYRQVLQLKARFTDEHGETKLTVDKPQVIHTLYNLAEVLDAQPPSQPTLRDCNLRKDCEELEAKYMEKFVDESFSAFQNFNRLMMTVGDVQDKFVLNDGQWYSDGLDWLEINMHFAELIERVQSTCDSAGVQCNLRLRSARIILNLIYTWDNELSLSRIKLFESVDQLYEYKPESRHKIVLKSDIVSKAMDCHLRPQKQKKSKAEKCPLCQTDVFLKRYEGTLFNMIQRENTSEEMSLKGSWKPKLEELVLKSLLAVLKNKNSKSEIIRDGDTHSLMIECLKKEFKELRKLWTFLDQQICALDELEICKVRLQLKTGEGLTKATEVTRILKSLTYHLENKNEYVNLLSVHELDYQNAVLKSEFRTSSEQLEKLLGTQKYLETLRKQQYEGLSPDPCPICKNTLEQHWSILLCGHSYCLECIQLLMEQIAGDHIQCSVCRNKQKYQEISYIRAGNAANDGDCSKIKGNFSTKIEGVIKLMLDLINADAAVKVLVFSSWDTVLKSMADAFAKNSIRCELARGGAFEQKIVNFKDSNDVTALLLPVNLGAKGLNLIEATHVILVEPLLNPSDELQAIGRVNRIGQSKPTFVHKFLIKNTIEESIHQATTSNAANWDKNAVTLQHLVDLFTANDLVAENVEVLDFGLSDT